MSQRDRLKPRMQRRHGEDGQGDSHQRSLRHIFNNFFGARLPIVAETALNELHHGGLASVTCEAALAVGGAQTP